MKPVGREISRISEEDEQTSLKYSKTNMNISKNTSRLEE
jgi:hypothetical protein